MTPVTLDEAIATALDNNPGLHATGGDHAAAVARAGAARSVFEPTFGATTTWQRSTSKGFIQGFPYEGSSSAWSGGVSVGGMAPTGTSYQLSTGLDRNLSHYTADFGAGDSESVQDAFGADVAFSLSQPLLEGGRPAAWTQSITRADRATDVAAANLERARQALIARTAAAYWDWAHAEEVVGIAEDELAASAEAQRVGELREAVGRIAPVELARLRAGVIQARTDRLAAAHTAVRARHTLELALGAYLSADATPATQPGEVPRVDLDPANAVEVALAHSLDLQVLRLQGDDAELSADLARHALLPDLTATASTGVGSQGSSISGALGSLATDPFPFVSLGAELSVPIGNRAARGSADAAAADLHAVGWRITEAEAALAVRVEEAVLTIEDAQLRVDLADANVDLSAELLAAEEARVASGGAIEQELLAARTAYARARSDAFRARADFRTGEVELLRLQGTLTVGTHE